LTRIVPRLATLQAGVITFIPIITSTNESQGTAHINQYQRNEFGTGDRYNFDLIIYDAQGAQIGNAHKAAVDVNGMLVISSRLPEDIIINVGTRDEDFVSVRYGDQSWVCDDNDGGAHKCTLGNGKNYGYDNGDREGDMGWTCGALPPPGPGVLQSTGVRPGTTVKSGTKLRILPVGDSITVGFKSSDGNG
jgi:hypothetical protein